MNISQNPELEKRIRDFIGIIRQEFNIDASEIAGLISRLSSEETHIPVSIFSRKLSSLETIVKYLRENLELTFSKIGELTGRDQKALSVTYRNAKKKMPVPLNIGFSKFFIPLSLLKNRNFSVLENIVRYLKDNCHLNYHKIAVLLHRDDRTIWTTYNRAKKK